MSERRGGDEAYRTGFRQGLGWGALVILALAGLLLMAVRAGPGPNVTAGGDDDHPSATHSP